MPTAFSNHFPTDPAASLSYRDLGGHVKAAHFVFENPTGNVIGASTTGERAWLTVLPPGAKIVGGFIMVTQSFGAGVTAATLRRETGDTNLFETGVTIDLTATTAPFNLDRGARGVGATMPEKPVNVKGERVGLALNVAGGAGVGRCHGVIFYI